MAQQLPSVEDFEAQQNKSKSTTLPNIEEFERNSLPSAQVRALEQKYTPGNVDIAKKFTPYAIPAIGLAAGAGAAYTAPVSAPAWVPGLLSSGTMATIGNLINKTDPNKGLAANIGIDTTFNELGGRVISGLTKGLGSLTAGEFASKFPRLAGKVPFKGSFGQGSMLGFKPTAAQLSGNRLLELIENNFGADSKEASLVRSGKISQEHADSLIQQVTGRTDISRNTPFKQAENISQNALEQFDASQKESSMRGNNIRFVAESKPSMIPLYAKDEFGGIHLSGYVPVKGAVTPNNLVNTAKQLMTEVESSSRMGKAPDPNSPLIKDLQGILLANQTLDASGNAIPKAANFKDAWQLKQEFGNQGFANPRNAQVITDARYKKLYAAINQDIEESIPKWGAGPDVDLAARQFKEAKIITNTRHSLFDEKPIEKQVNEETNAVAGIDSIVHNPKLLAKALSTGTLVIPESATKDVTGIKYITNNTKQDLAGYELQSLLKKAQVTDAKGNVSYDGQKLLGMFNDSANQESYKMLWNSQHRADINQFFKNISATDTKGQVGPSSYRLMRLGLTGLTLGSGLATGMVSGSLPAGAGTSGAIVGAVIGLNHLSKLLTNPDSARLMVSLANNGPLNMSTQLAGRVIANVLKGKMLKVQTNTGDVDMKVGPDGKLGIPLDKNIGGIK